MVLDIRRNINSLHEIYSIIDSTKEFFEQGNQLTVEEKKLIFQRILHVIGENVKNTGDTPNLSDDVSRSLEEKGVPVRYLSEFRDLLAHHVLPIGEFNKYKIEKLYETGLVPIQTIVGNEIAKVREMLKETSTKNIYDASIQKKYEQFDQAKGSERALEISNPIAKFIHESKLSTFDSMKSLLDKSSRVERIDSHDDFIRITNVEGYLLYGKDVSSDDVLDGFLDETTVLKNIKVASKGSVSLKESLEPYFDGKSFKEKRFYYDLPNDIEVQGLVTSFSTQVKDSSDSKKVIGFLKSISKIQDTNSNDFPLDKFKRLVEGLNIEGKEDLYDFVTRWEERKDLIDPSQTNKDFTPEKLKEIVSDISNKQEALLLFANEWTEVKSFLAMLDNTKSDQGKLINFFKSIGQDISDNHVPHDEFERLVQNLSIDGDKKKKLVSFSGKLRKVGDLSSSLNDVISRSGKLKRFCGYIATQRKLSRLNANLPKGDDKGFQLIVENAQQLIKLLKSVSTSQDIVSKYIKPDDFKTLVKNLAVDDNVRQDLFSVLEKLERVKSLINLLNTVEDSNGGKIKLMKFFKSYSQSQGNKGHYLSPNEYKNLIDNLSLNDQSKEELFLFSIEWRKNKCFSLLRRNPVPIGKTYQNMIEGKTSTGQNHHTLLTETRKKQVDLIKALSNPYAIEAQFINLYSLLERLEKNQGNPFFVRRLRNRLAHDKENEEFRGELFKLIHNAKDKLSESNVVDLSAFNKLIKNVQSNSGSSQSSLNLCIGKASRAPAKRSIAECLFSKEDVEKFSKGKVDENNVDKVIIDSEKFLTYIKSSQGEAKNAQLMEFIGNKNIEGDYKYLVDKAIVDRGYERYIQNERVNDFYGEVLHQNSGFEKNSKLKSRLMNAAGKIQLIRGIQGAVVSCEHGTAVDCGLNLGGIGWSFASQPIENVMVKVAPKIIDSSAKVLQRVIPGTLGRQTKFAVQVVGVKFGSTMAKGAAGAVGGVFDLIDIGISANNLIDCKNREKSDNPCGEKEIRDSIASISFSSVSFVSGVALVAAGLPGVGTAVGLGIMVAQGVYSGVSNIIEYEKKYDTTPDENWSIFWRTVLLQPMSYDVSLLQARYDRVNIKAKAIWESLNNSPGEVVAYAVGLGQINYDTLSFDAGYGKILMNRTDVDTTSLSRAIPEPIQDSEMICLPQFIERAYEKNIKKSVPTAIHYCEDAMVIADTRRKNDGTVIFYNLQDINAGTIVGSSKLKNYFFIFGGGMTIIGGNNTVNRFLFSQTSSFFGSVRGGYDATNIIDLSQSKNQSSVLVAEVNYLFYRSCVLHLKLVVSHDQFMYDYVNIGTDTNYVYVGRGNGLDDVVCSYDYVISSSKDCGYHVLIDSGGGLNKDKRDIVDNCKKVAISPYTKVTGVGNDYTFYIKTTRYKAKDLYSEIDVNGKGTVIFPETNLLNDCDEISYNNNTLSLKISLGQGNQYTLDIRNYIEKSSSNPNFVLIDKNGSNIIPKIEKLVSPTTKINSFEVHSEHSLASFNVTENHYDKVLSNNKGYEVFAVFKENLLQSQSNSSTLRHTIFGSSQSDVINFNQANMCAKGGNGSDLYIIDNKMEKIEVTIDNNSDDKKLDMLIMTELPEQLSTQQCNLHLSFNNIHVQIKDYLKDNSYRHLMFMNNRAESFIPYMQSISCVGSSEENVKLAHFFHATQTQNMFLLPKDFQDDYVVIDSRLEDIARYRSGGDLLLIRNSEDRFIIKIEDFYNDQDKWRDVNFLLWNHGNFSPYFGLHQEVNGVMDYLDKLKGDYEKSIKEYDIDFTKSFSIEHNQDSTLTSMGDNKKLVGVMILRNITPGRVQVSSSGRDLVFSDKVSKHAITVKSWNSSEFYRISRLEFDLGLEPIVVRRLDQFSLSKIGEIQDLINKALEICEKRDGLELNKHLLATLQDGDFSKVKAVLNRCVNINAQNEDGCTSLHYAATMGNLEVVKYIVEKGADFNMKDNFAWTPLHLASMYGKLEVVKYLKERGASLNVVDTFGATPLHSAAVDNRLEVVRYMVEEGVDVNAKDKYGRTPLDLARRRHNSVAEYLEKKLNETRGEPKQRRRRHHHGDYSFHHLSRKPLSAGLDDQPEIAMSGGTRPSSWIRGLFGWAKSSIDGLLNPKPEGISSTKDSISQRYSASSAQCYEDKIADKPSNYKSSVNGLLGYKPEGTASSVSQVDGQFAKASISNSSFTGTTLPSDGTDKRQENGGFFQDNVDYVNANLKRMCERQAPVKFKPKDRNTILEMGDHYLSQIDFNGTITLFDLLIRRVTGQKYISTVDQSISPLEAQKYTLNITKEFEKVVEQAALRSGISMHRLNIDYMGMQKEITRKVMSGKFNEISGILKSYVEKACPGEEAGKLSPKKFEKFIAQFNKGLLNQSIEQILYNRDGRLEVDDTKQMSLEPQSYLSNASVHSHSKVSTCLSDVGVTKLGNTLSK